MPKYSLLDIERDIEPFKKTHPDLYYGVNHLITLTRATDNLRVECDNENASDKYLEALQTFARHMLDEVNCSHI